MTLFLLFAPAAGLAAESDWSAVTALKPGQQIMISYAKRFREGRG
jgi:hypothetical protein